MNTMERVNQNSTQFSVKQVQFYTEDGYGLQGRYYVPVEPAKAKILIACATGVPQAFYRRFAEYMCTQGFALLSFDYRGIASSAPKHLKHMQMSYLDWGRYDLTAAIHHLKHIHPHAQSLPSAHASSLSQANSDIQPQSPSMTQPDHSALPIFMIGHSYGGQSLGLSAAHADVDALFCFGTGAGWAGYMPAKERFKVQVVWNIVFPPLVAVSGYLPWSKFKMGADLPKGVYQEWRRWCKSPLYFFADPEIGAALAEQYAQVTTPIYAFSALDDDWALANSRQAFIQHYRNAAIEYIDLNPQDYQMQQIGHMGYFRADAQPIWDMLVQRMQALING